MLSNICEIRNIEYEENTSQEKLFSNEYYRVYKFGLIQL